jgi:hypothetical protein
LNNNNLTELPKLIRDLIVSRYLHLSNNNLEKLPQEIGSLTALIEFDLSNNNLTELPKEIGNLINVTALDLFENQLTELVKEIGNLSSLMKLRLSKNKLKELPKEIGNLQNLKELYLYENKLIKFPKEIVNLTNLVKFYFKDNPNLILTKEQKEWIGELITNGCDIVMDDVLYSEIELARRYRYLDEFNIGREIPITTEILNNDIPSRINDRLANSEVIFEEYLDEVSEYLEKEKLNNTKTFNTLVEKLYHKDYELGACFERNIAFESFEDNKLTWSSIADGEDKKMLIEHWGLINVYVKGIFGFETKIVNIAVRQNEES